MGTQYQYRNKPPVARSSGFSLVEILVAVTIGIVLMTGIVQIFLANKQTYRTTEAMSRMQENTRYAMHVLTKDLRIAGSTACGNLSKIANFLADTTSWQFNFENAVTGYEGGVDTFPTEFTYATDGVAPVAGTDAVAILSAGDKGFRIKSHQTASANIQLSVGTDNDLEDGDIVMICDNNQASILQITSINGTGNTVHNTGAAEDPGNCTNKMGYPRPNPCNAAQGSNYDYDTSPDSKMVELSAVAYYIATSNTCATRCLYRLKLDANGGASGFGPPDLIVEGVENMQILYGRDTDADGAADLYNTANNVSANWDEVVSVRLGLLMHTVEEVANVGDLDTTAYNVVDTSIGGTSGVTTIQHDEDRRLRFVAPTTVKLRNRGCSGTNGC